jgi:hypothetical protein
VVLQEGLDISRSYRALAKALSEASSNSGGSPDVAYDRETADVKSKGFARPSLAPVRAGQ